LVLNQKDELSGIQSELDNLASIIKQGSMEKSIREIKNMEEALSNYAGISDLKNQLAKSRRTLKDDNPNVELALQHHSQAMIILNTELEWRNKAIGLLPYLNQYNQVIKDTIGLRLQSRFTKEQAKSIAACRSVHQDISLSF